MNLNKSIWPSQKFGLFLNIGAYPNDVRFFKKYLPMFKQMFKINERYVQEAQLRLHFLTT